MFKIFINQDGFIEFIKIRKSVHEMLNVKCQVEQARSFFFPSFFFRVEDIRYTR